MSYLKKQKVEIIYNSVLLEREFNNPGTQAKKKSEIVFS